LFLPSLLNATPTTYLSTLSLHDALPISNPDERQTARATPFRTEGKGDIRRFASAPPYRSGSTAGRIAGSIRRSPLPSPRRFSAGGQTRRAARPAGEGMDAFSDERGESPVRVPDGERGPEGGPPCGPDSCPGSSPETRRSSA